jgi:glycosyltransferase involved in cell wall biosynthesis
LKSNQIPKILHIITRLDMGGSAQNTLLTCLELSRRFGMVLVCGLSQESNMINSEKEAVEKQTGIARLNGVRIVSIPSLVRRISPLNDVRALYELYRIIQKERPDIVHTHTSKAGILGRLAAKIAGVPYIVHTPHGHVFYGHFGRSLSRIFLWLERLFALFTDRLVALTEGELQDNIDLSVYPADRIIKIHSGVNVQKFQSVEISIIDKKRSLGIETNGRTVGFVGWLLPIKGPMYLLRAMEYVWQEYNDTNLVFVGKGDLDVDIRAEALKLNTNGRVKFLGWRDDIREIMPIFDIFVLPSLNEGMGRVLVEAMAAGKPVVASRVGGIPDLVRHGETGYLVPPADEEALANGIKKLLNNPEKAKLMGQQGREICDQFSVGGMVEKIDNLYKELLNSQHPLQASCFEPRPGKSIETHRTRRRDFFSDPKIAIKEKSQVSRPEKTKIAGAK